MFNNMLERLFTITAIKNRLLLLFIIYTGVIIGEFLFDLQI